MSANLAFRRQPIVSQMWLLVSLLLGVAACGIGARCAAADDITPAQAFAAAQVAAKANSESLVSAIGVGEFTDLLQHKDDDEPQLWSKAKVHVYFDRGRYHVQLVYEKRLQRFVTNESGTRRYPIADAKFDDVRIIATDDEVYAVTFAKKVGPTGCQGSIFSKQQQQFGFATIGFPWNEPARLWMNFLDIDQFIKENGADAITYSDLGEGRFRARYVDTKPYTTELEVERLDASFRMTEQRLFNPDKPNPIDVTKATWKQVRDTWYVHEYRRETDTRGSGAKFESLNQSRFRYDSFDVNVKVEPALFSLNSLTIPVGTQFSDRRPNAASPVQFWNGTALQTERP